MRFDAMEAEDDRTEREEEEGGEEEAEEEADSSSSEEESSDGEADGSEGEDWESGSESDDDGLPVDQPHSSSDDDDSVDKCPVCLKALRDQMIGMPESCDHDFCLDCLKEWATSVNTCPIDRQVFRLILVKCGVDGVIQRRIPVEDKQMETEDAPVVEVANCEICRRGDREDRLLLCDSCDLGFHLDCLTPALSRVPRGDWFCPQCVQAVPQEGPAAILPRLQMLARTPVVMRVRAAIRRLRIVSDSEDDDDDDQAMDVDGRPSTSTPQKRKTIKKEKKKGKRKLKRSVKKTKNSSGKTSGKRKKRKKGGKKKARTKSSKSSTTKSRIADHLGIKKPAPGCSLPRVKGQRSEPNIDTMRTDSGISSLSIMGDRDDLPYFSDSENDDMVSQQHSSSGVAVASRSSYVLNHHQAKRILAKSAASLTSPLRRSVSQPPCAEEVPFDLLGNILAGQKQLLTNSKAVKILRDGSLDTSNATPQDDGDSEQSQSPPPPHPPPDTSADSTTSDRSETTAATEATPSASAMEASNSGSSASDGAEKPEALYDPFNPDSDSEKDERKKKKQKTEVSTSAIQPGDMLSIEDDDQGMDGEDVMIEIIEEEEEEEEEEDEEEPPKKKELYDPFEEDDGKKDDEAARGVSEEAEADSTAEQATVSACDEQPVKEEQVEAVVGSTSEPEGDSSQSSDTKDAKKAVVVPSSEVDLEGSRHRNSTPSVDKDSKVKEEGYFKWEWEKSAGAEVEFKSGKKPRRDERHRSRDSKERDNDRPRRSRHSRSKSRERTRRSSSRERRRRSRSHDRSRRRRSRSRDRRRRSRSRSRSPRHDRRRSRSRDHGRNNSEFKGSMKMLSQSLKDAAEDTIRRPAFNRQDEKKVDSPEKIRQEQRRKQQQQQQQQEEEEAANLMEDYVPEELYVRPDQHSVMRPGGPLLPTPPGPPPPMPGMHHMHPMRVLEQMPQMPPQRDHGPLLPTPHDHTQPPEALMRPPNLHAMHHQFQMMEQLPPGSRDPGPPSAPPQFLTVSEGNLRAVLTPQMQQLQMLQQNLRGVGRPPLLMNPVLPPPGAAFQGGIPRLGPPHWQALQPQAGSAIMLPNRMQLQVSQPQSTIGIGQNGPEAPIMAFAPLGPPPVSMHLPQLPAELRARLMEAPPRPGLLGQMDMSSENTPPPPLPTVPDSLATPPPPLPARALQEMHQISQLLNAQAKQGDQEDLYPFHPGMPPPPPPADESRLFKVPLPPPPHPKPGQQPSLRFALETLFHRSSVEPDSSKLNDNTEAIDMDVSSPLSDEELDVVFPPAAVAPRNQEPPAPEKGVSFALPPTGEDDAVPSSAVELDNQQKRQQEFMKLNRKERVVEEVKLAIKPYYAKGKINKDQYKEIMRKAVPKICHSRSGDINPNRIRSYIESYVSKIRQAVKYEHKKQEPTSQSQDKAARKPAKQRPGQKHSRKPQKAK